jgi:hypothetical protein
MSDSKENQVLDLEHFRRSKTIAKHLAKGKTPLYVSHLDGEIRTNQPKAGRGENDFAARIQRIRRSLERINALMGQLREKKKKEEDQ